MSVNNGVKRCLGEKLALAGGAASLALASGNPAETAVVSALNTPISPPSSTGSIDWDVDGDSNAEFRLGNASFVGFHSAVFTELNGAFVAPSFRFSDGFAKLATGFVVGASMSGGFKFLGNQTFITVTGGGSIGGDLGAQGWSLGDVGYFGFKFASGSNTYYGWGEISIHGGSPGSGFTIKRAYYDDTPGASIRVGVPEPSTCALALLAAGGVAAYKGRRKKAAV